MIILLGLLAIVVGILLAAPPRRVRALRPRWGGAALEPPDPVGVLSPGDATAGDATADDAEPAVAEDETPPRELQLGDMFTRAEIHAMFGGGMQDFLPHVDGRVVCGCFHPGYNPYAPFVVLPGLRPSVQRWAMLFAAQDEAVPCFLKRATGAWEYVGDFRVAELSRDPDEIEEWARIAEREGDVSMVLHLEAVSADDSA